MDVLVSSLENVMCKLYRWGPFGSLGRDIPVLLWEKLLYKDVDYLREGYRFLWQIFVYISVPYFVLQFPC